MFTHSVEELVKEDYVIESPSNCNYEMITQLAATKDKSVLA